MERRHTTTALLHFHDGALNTAAIALRAKIVAAKKAPCAEAANVEARVMALLDFFWSMAMSKA